MKYLDTSILVSYILTDDSEHATAVNILKSLANQKETALLSILNIAELFYVLQRERVSLSQIRQTAEDFMQIPGIKLVEVPSEISLEVLKLAEKYEIDFTDAATYLLMKKYQIKEIYSLDPHFDKFKDIWRLNEPPSDTML